MERSFPSWEKNLTARFPAMTDNWVEGVPKKKMANERLIGNWLGGMMGAKTNTKANQIMDAIKIS